MRSLLLLAAVTLLAGCGHAPLVTSAAAQQPAAQNVAKGCYCGGGGGGTGGGSVGGGSNPI